MVLGAVRGYHFSTTYSQYVNQATALVVSFGKPLNPSLFYRMPSRCRDRRCHPFHQRTMLSAPSLAPQYGVVSSFHLWALAKWDRWDHWRLARETVDEGDVTAGGYGGDGDGGGGSGSAGGYGRGAKGDGQIGSNSEALLNGHERYDDSGGVPDGPVDVAYVGPGALRVNGADGDLEDDGGANVTGGLTYRTSFGRHSGCEAPPTLPIKTQAGNDQGGPPLNAICERGSITSPLYGKAKEPGKHRACVP